MTLLNGVGAAVLTESQQACVDLLTEALSEAKKGNVDTVGIVVCMKAGFATVMAGHRAADLHLGGADLQRKILEAVTGGNVKRPPRSNLVLARPAG